jgi:hypothetical protein
MSTFPPSMDPGLQGAPAWQTPPKPGMGCGMKVLIALGILFALLLVLCCGGGIWWVASLKNAMTEDPAKVRIALGDITQIDVPPPLEPQVAFNLKFPVIGEFMRFVVFADAKQDSTLVLFALGEALKSQNQAEMRRQIEQQMQQQGIGNQEQEELKNRLEGHKEVLVRGEKAMFTIIRGTGARSNVRRIQVQGTFLGKTGPVVLLLDADADKLPEEKVIGMLESIR